VKTTGLEVISFETTVDRISFRQHLSDCSVVQTVTKVTTDEGAEGYYLGWPFSPPRWLLHKGGPSEGFKTITACPRTSSVVTVSKSCCCPRI